MTQSAGEGCPGTYSVAAARGGAYTALNGAACSSAEYAVAGTASASAVSEM